MKFWTQWQILNDVVAQGPDIKQFSLTHTKT